MPSSSWGFAPSRRALVIVCALAFTLLLSTTLLQVSPDSTLRSLRVPFFSSSSIVMPMNETDVETIIFSLVMFGRNSAEEGQHMIKSILLQTSRAVELHIICSADAVPVLRRRLDLVSRPAVDVVVVFYPLTEDAVLQRGARAGIASAHHAGVGGLAKMFMHELVPAQRALYVDTDSLFVADPLLLWRAMPTAADAGVLLSLPHAGPQSTGAQLCTCVMAMRLDRMREAPFMPSTHRPETIGHSVGGDSVWAAAGIDPLRPPWGDQGLIHAMWQAAPKRFGRLSRSWDITACSYFYGTTLVGSDVRTQDEESAHAVHLGLDAPDAPLFPGLVHFNCQPRDWTGSAFDQPAVRSRPEWGSLLNLTTAYKWVWLNQGQGTMKISVVDNAMFEDERVAEARVPTRVGALLGHAHDQNV